MSRRTHITHEFVEFIPSELEDGVLYVSGEYSTVAHSCFCGCGGKVVTPLSPAQWHLTFDGETVTLKPSIGSGSLPCNSHYWITNNELRWMPGLTKQETRSSQQRDRHVAQRYFEDAAKPIARWHVVRRWKQRRQSKS